MGTCTYHVRDMTISGLVSRMLMKPDVLMGFWYGGRWK